MTNHYTMDEIAELLGLKYYRIAYQHRIGALAEPTRVGGRRAYSRDDLRRVAEHFGLPMPEFGPDERSRADARPRLPSTADNADRQPQWPESADDRR